MIWTSVEASMPEEMETVTVSLESDIVRIGFHCDSEWQLETDKVWLASAENLKVTHWMPLPAPADVSINGEWPEYSQVDNH